MDKATLRKSFIDRRRGLSRSDYWNLTDGILEQVESIDWGKFRIVHIFLPIRNANEVDTFSILNYFKSKHPALGLVVPRTNFKTNTLENIHYDHEFSILGRNSYGIPEPIHGRTISPSQIDAVFVPLLAFDQRGNRVGYGKGFYDRFLSECRKDVLKIGLSYFEPVAEISDVNEYDIRLDRCITPSTIWLFGDR